MSLVRYNLGNRNEDYKDVVNDALVTVLLSLREGKYDPSKGKSLESYILGIAYRKIRDYYDYKKKQQKDIQADASLEIDFIGEDSLRLEQQESRDLLIRVLKSLPFKYQHILYLRYFENASVHEIAQQLGLDPRRVSERIHYSLILLKKLLKKESLLTF